MLQQEFGARIIADYLDDFADFDHADKENVRDMAVRMLKNRGFDFGDFCVFGRKGAAEWFEQGRAFAQRYGLCAFRLCGKAGKTGSRALGRGVLRCIVYLV